ncbi:unnamed protein product [Rotaria sp. Silwood1]|nr:unnamed protein product [Rotaria sp. Silwood1]CAF3647362.1 unnamed protein product [Rotaria sp. Silwood1]
MINLLSRLSTTTYTQSSDVENASNGIFAYNREEIKFPTTHVKLMINYNSTDDIHVYFFVRYSYSQANITIDHHHHPMILNQTHIIKNYHCIPLLSNLFHNSIHQKHFLDIHVHYIPTLDKREDKSYVYPNRISFYLNLAMLFA